MILFDYYSSKHHMQNEVHLYVEELLVKMVHQLIELVLEYYLYKMLIFVIHLHNN